MLNETQYIVQQFHHVHSFGTSETGAVIVEEGQITCKQKMKINKTCEKIVLIVTIFSNTIYHSSTEQNERINLNSSNEDDGLNRRDEGDECFTADIA